MIFQNQNFSAGGLDWLTSQFGPPKSWLHSYSLGSWALLTFKMIHSITHHNMPRNYSNYIDNWVLRALSLNVPLFFSDKILCGYQFWSYNNMLLLGLHNCPNTLLRTTRMLRTYYLCVTFYIKKKQTKNTCWVICLIPLTIFKKVLGYINT